MRKINSFTYFKIILFLLFISWIQIGFSMLKVSETNAITISTEEAPALRWRKNQLAQMAIEKESPLEDAITKWQGCNRSGGFEEAFNTIAKMPAYTMNEFLKATDWDHSKRKTLRDIALIVSNMKPIGQPLILWHAAAHEPDMNQWLPTSATRTGAEIIAKEYGCKHIYKLIVDENVLSIAIGTDRYYEKEKEILLEPGLQLEQTDSPEEFIVHRPDNNRLTKWLQHLVRI